MVRNKELRNPLFVETLSGTKLRASRCHFASGRRHHAVLAQRRAPRSFPVHRRVFELKRQGEDPARMFAGEGTPERTNKRFHYLNSDSAAKRLSTAFDSVTLYGEDPHERPDIYGKIGNSGVSVCTVDDARKLYSGFDLKRAHDVGLYDDQRPCADGAWVLLQRSGRSADRAASS